jgi:hypothetical protein
VLNRLRAAARETAEETETALTVRSQHAGLATHAGQNKGPHRAVPSLLQPALSALPPGSDEVITRKTIEVDSVHRLDVDPARTAQFLTAAGAMVAQSVSIGQMKDVQSQLPGRAQRGLFDVCSAVT